MSGGPIEVVTRVRCAACGSAFERQSIAQVDQFPCKLKVEIGYGLPAGFVAEEGRIYCHEHLPTLLTLATHLPRGLRELPLVKREAS